MKLKMKKIVATVTALALSLTGAITLGITSNAQTYQYQSGTTQKTIDTIEGPINISFPVLYAGNKVGDVWSNRAETIGDNYHSYNFMYASLEDAQSDDVSKIVPFSDGNGNSTLIEEGKDYYIRVNMFANTDVNDPNHTIFLTDKTTFTFENCELVSKDADWYTYQALQDAGLTDQVTGKVVLIVKMTGQPNPNGVTEEFNFPSSIVDVTPAPVEAVEEPAPIVEEAPAVEEPVVETPAETVKATNTAPKTGDTLPIVPFVLMGIGVVAGSVVVLQKRYF